MSRSESTIDPHALALLRCPITGGPLREIARDGRAVLATADGRIIYEIRDGVPILLPPDRPGASVRTIPSQPPA